MIATLGTASVETKGIKVGTQVDVSPTKLVPVNSIRNVA
jgi:hypothetical protein